MQEVVVAGSLLPLMFEEARVRLMVRDNAPWWVLADVCRALGINNPSQAATKLDDDEKTSLTNNEGVPGFNGAKTVTLINEPGLYSVILRSRKPEARRFDRWIRHDVLPSIRQTGSYAAPGQGPSLPDEVRNAIGGIVKAVVGKMLTEQATAIQHLAVQAHTTDAVVQNLADQVRTMIVEADPRIAAIAYRPMLEVLIEHGIGTKRRRALSQKCSRRLTRWCLDRELPDAVRISRESGRYLFQPSAIQGWMKAEGATLIAEHRAAIEGQGVLTFKKPKLVS